MRLATLDHAVSNPILPDLAGLRVAVVDDSRNFRDLLRMILRSFGVRRVDALAAPDDVVPFLSQNQIDVVFVDLVLPGTNGIRLARQIRHATGVLKREAPIVLVTGHASRAAVVAAVAAGIDDILAKPLSPRTVHSHLHRLLTRPARYVAGADGYFGPDLAERRHALLARLSADRRRLLRSGTPETAESTVGAGPAAAERAMPAGGGARPAAPLSPPVSPPAVPPVVAVAADAQAPAPALPGLATPDRRGSADGPPVGATPDAQPDAGSTSSASTTASAKA
jgi:DNA-binding response OmpR family regulator